MNTTLPPRKTSRDLRLDVFRGLALLTIFVNHVPGNFYERFTSRNFGFSDAAEAFVLMSGIAVGLAYSRGFRAGDFGNALLRIWRRAGTIYVAHIVTSVIAIAIVASGILYLDTVDIVRRVNFTRLLDRPLSAMVGIPTLGHQLGYFNILPLYFTLLIVSPFYIVLGLRNRWAMLGLAFAIWFLAGMFRLNLPNFPNPGGWFFNPISWQLVYAIGIAMGLSMTEGRKLVLYDSRLFGLAVAFLVLAFFWVQLRLGALPGRETLPFFIAGFDKSFVAAPRLLHVLALTYVVVNLPAVAWLIATPFFRPVALMGRNGLAVFATGSVLAIALQVLRARFQTSFFEDTALLAGGILVQYGIAWFLTATSEKKRTDATYRPEPAGQPAEPPLAGQPGVALYSQSGIESRSMRSP
ncbi:OpgC family protein [Nitratireductor sp. GCM10026969]|uniref:OpgC family protein n=1 Tax=Nitratireductor sp. GCM10026969 TaxID=3252645 RepID=UPI003607AD19